MCRPLKRTKVLIFLTGGFENVCRNEKSVEFDQ